MPRRLLLLLLLLLPIMALTVRIYNESSMYAYHGCFNETTDIDGSDRSRALADGIVQVRQGEMTVPLCLAICANGRTRYRYAGLEWSRCVFTVFCIAGPGLPLLLFADATCVVRVLVLAGAFGHIG